VVRSVEFDEQISPLSHRLVPDELWALAQPLIPLPKVRPQGGGRSRVGDRSVFVAVVYVLTSGCAWRRLPPSFGIAVPTAYRRFVEWSGLKLWEKLDAAVVADGGDEALAEWTREIRHAAATRPTANG
jgi:transposase